MLSNIILSVLLSVSMPVALSITIIAVFSLRHYAAKDHVRALWYTSLVCSESERESSGGQAREDSARLAWRNQQQSVKTPE